MQGPEPPTLHDEPSVVNQATTTLEHACRSMHPWADHVSSWVAGVGHALQDDAKRVRRALCREVSRRKQTPLDPQNKALRNSIQELYFGITVMMVAVCSGQLLGSLLGYGAISPLGFATSCAEVVAIVGLTLYAYLHLRKNRSEDMTLEYRSWLFGLCFTLSLLLGHLLGQRLISTVPATFFIPPLLTALLIDSTVPIDFYSNRTKLMCAVTALGSVGTFVAMFCAGLFSYHWLLIGGLHYIILFAHYEIVAGNISSKRFRVVESQLLYVVVLLVFQTLVGLVFGGVPN